MRRVGGSFLEGDIMQKRKPAPETFELGLVMAGAVSAGAYTAGVLDFLFEALGEWEAAKLAALNGGPAVPSHKVVIRASSGASAGGIASALVAMVPFTGHTPVRSPTDTAAMAKNLFYKCWVSGIDLANMLGTRDIGADGNIYSLLDGTALDDVAATLAKATRTAISVGRMVSCWLRGRALSVLEVKDTLPDGRRAKRAGLSPGPRAVVVGAKNVMAMDAPLRPLARRNQNSGGAGGPSHTCEHFGRETAPFWF